MVHEYCIVLFYYKYYDRPYPIVHRKDNRGCSVEKEESSIHPSPPLSCNRCTLNGAWKYDKGDRRYTLDRNYYCHVYHPPSNSRTAKNRWRTSSIEQELRWWLCNQNPWPERTTAYTWDQNHYCHVYHPPSNSRGTEPSRSGTSSNCRPYLKNCTINPNFCDGTNYSFHLRFSPSSSSSLSSSSSPSIEN